MRIVIPSIQVPFIRGGAELMTNGLKNALIQRGHEVDIVSVPFKFSPESYVSNLIDVWKEQDFNNFNGYRVDKVIALQFPAYYVKHDDKVLWLMHQHRSVYELYNKVHASAETNSLRGKIHLNDSLELNKINKKYSMCQNITNRLKKHNDLESIPIYHPPANEERFYCDESYDFIFYPSRLEELKRQKLLIEAMQYTTSPVVSIIAGNGGQFNIYKQLINKLGVADKVSLIGHIDEEEKYTLYARSLGVFFAPFDEDYGYITLEAMLSSKPVITCNDSGGPLEFVIDNETGFVVDSEPKIIAEKLDWLYFNKKKAKEMGVNGLHEYKAKNISWSNVVSNLLKD
jgi:glycosyltransferase involved in cell wall biosynthesis